MAQMTNATQLVSGISFDSVMEWEDYLDAIGTGATRQELAAHYLACPDKTSDTAIYLKQALDGGRI